MWRVCTACSDPEVLHVSTQTCWLIGWLPSSNNQRLMKTLLVTRWQMTVSMSYVCKREMAEGTSIYRECFVAVWIHYCTVKFNGHWIRVCSDTLSSFTTSQYIHTEQAHTMYYLFPPTQQPFCPFYIQKWKKSLFHNQFDKCVLGQI